MIPRIVIANFKDAILARRRLRLRHHHNHRNNHHDRREKLLVLDIFQFEAKFEFEAILLVSLSLLLRTRVRLFVVALVVVCKIEANLVKFCWRPLACCSANYSGKHFKETFSKLSLISIDVIWLAERKKLLVCLKPVMVSL